MHVTLSFTSHRHMAYLILLSLLCLVKDSEAQGDQATSLSAAS